MATLPLSEDISNIVKWNNRIILYFEMTDLLKLWENMASPKIPCIKKVILFYLLSNVVCKEDLLNLGGHYLSIQLVG